MERTWWQNQGAIARIARVSKTNWRLSWIRYAPRDVATDDVMKRSPREYPANHPHTDLLSHRSILASRTLAEEDVLWTSRASDWVAERAMELDDLLDWLARSVAVPANLPG